MSLKIKVFVWFLKKKVLLTQDNLSKRKSNGSTKYCLSNSEATVNHHFISCPFAKLVWHVVDDTFDIHHRLILQLYGNWVNGIDRKTKAKIHIGVSTLCCFIWNFRNNIVFNRKKLIMFCRLFIWMYSRFIYGVSCPIRSVWMYGFWMQPFVVFSRYLVWGYLPVY
jgi:hypothetical protein